MEFSSLEGFKRHMHVALGDMSEWWPGGTVGVDVFRGLNNSAVGKSKSHLGLLLLRHGGVWKGRCFHWCMSAGLLNFSCCPCLLEDGSCNFLAGSKPAACRLLTLLSRHGAFTSGTSVSLKAAQTFLAIQRCSL